MAAEEDKIVSIVEMMDEIARDDLFINQISLHAKLEETGVKIYTNCKVIKMDKYGVHVENSNGSTESIPADSIITSFGMKENKEIAEKIKEKYPRKTKVIGDCVKVGRIGTAIRMGYFAGSSIH